MTGLLKLPDSLWAATATPALALTRLAEDIDVDVAIVGGGFTGLRAALMLAKSSVEVVLVDAGEPGWGASGRNGGQVNPMGHETIEQMQQRIGSEYGERLAGLMSRSADELFDLIKTLRISCDASQHGWIRAAHCNGTERDIGNMYKSWTSRGAALELLDQQEVSRRTGSPIYGIGWLARQGGSIQPLSYARGLARSAIKAGARIYRHSAVSTLQQKNGKWRLTAAGEGRQFQIRAENVLLCTNGYTDSLWPGLQQSVVPVISVQAATRPLPADLADSVLPGSNSLSDTRRVIFYTRKTPDHRLLFGTAGLNADQPGHGDRLNISRAIGKVFPQLQGVEIEYLWGGRLAVTRDHLPHLHQPAKGVAAGLGYNGRGVAMATAMGRLLAELILGKSPADLPVPVTGISAYPFHRFHSLGVSMAVHWKSMQDRIDKYLN